MIQGGDLPEDIIRLILTKRFSDSVLSLEHWKSCLEALAVCRKWRNIGIPLLYHNVIAEYRVVDDMLLCASSNIPLVLINGYNVIPRALLLHMPKFPTLALKQNLMVQDLSMRMAQWAFTPGLMRDFWSRFTFITTSLVGASIEPALLRMPRLSHFFFSTDELIDGEGPRGANFTNYNVGRQLAPPFMPTDASFEVDVVLGISQLPANIGTHELLMYRQQSDDYVEILSAEYIDRLITTDLAEYLILNATEGLPRLADNGLLDRAPHDTSWRFVRNRYMFFFADIRFEGHDVVPSSYSLAIFDRENDQLVTDIDSEEYEDSNHGTASSSNGTVITGSSADFLDESSFDESPYDDSASDDTAVDM